jgi:hypothetical protein
MGKWRRGSEFGPGLKVKLDRNQREVFRALLKLRRKPGLLSQTAVRIGFYLSGLLGQDGQLDPAIKKIAKAVQCATSTVAECLDRLKTCGFLTWTRRLVRRGSVVEQTSNAYVLLIPGADTDFRPAVGLPCFKKQAHQQGRGVDPAYENAARQLRALGVAVPAAWGLG